MPPHTPKNDVQTFKHEIFTFFPFWEVNFDLSGSGAAYPIEFGSHPDPDPKHWSYFSWTCMQGAGKQEGAGAGPGGV
jgi:hypothetical protein